MQRGGKLLETKSCLSVLFDIKIIYNTTYKVLNLERSLFSIFSLTLFSFICNSLLLTFSSQNVKNWIRRTAQPIVSVHICNRTRRCWCCRKPSDDCTDRSGNNWSIVVSAANRYSCGDKVESRRNRSRPYSTVGTTLPFYGYTVYFEQIQHLLKCYRFLKNKKEKKEIKQNVTAQSNSMLVEITINIYLMEETKNKFKFL